MGVDEAGGDDEAGGIDGAACGVAGWCADEDDAVVEDADVCLDCGCAGAVDKRSIVKDEVELGRLGAEEACG